MAENKNKQWVSMKHPKIEAEPNRVTLAAFEKVWKPKGWTLHQEPTTTSSTTSTKKGGDA